MKTVMTILMIGLVCGLQAQIRTYDDFKTNENGMVDRHGFGEKYKDSYIQWDRNGDNRIEPRDLYETTYSRLDANRDNNLSQDEWQYGHDNLFGKYVGAADYTSLDYNKDGKVSDIEYYKMFNTSGYYNSYDTNGDGNISVNEMNENVFTNWDRNRDGFLDQNEYDTYSPLYNNPARE